MHSLRRNCQDLWIGVFQATSVSVDSASVSAGVMSTGRLEQFAFVEDWASTDEGD